MNCQTWMPLYVGDFVADTMHLNAEQTGAYLALLMAEWRMGPLEDNANFLARIARVPLVRWLRTVGPVVRTFFDTTGGRLSQKRLEAERATAVRNREARISAARARWNRENDRESGKINDIADANAYATPIVSTVPSPSPIRKEERVPTTSDASASKVSEFSWPIEPGKAAKPDAPEPVDQPLRDVGAAAAAAPEGVPEQPAPAPEAAAVIAAAPKWVPEPGVDYVAMAAEVMAEFEAAHSKDPFPARRTGLEGDIRSRLWSIGLRELIALTGLPEGRARGFMGRLLKAANDDCAGILDALARCPDTGDPQAWLMAAAVARGRKPVRESYNQRMYRELGLDPKFDHLFAPPAGQPTGLPPGVPQ